MSSFRERWKYEHGDPSVKMWDFAVRDGWIDLPEGASVLELGCCETDWHKYMKAADPTLVLVGIDVNDCPDYTGHFERWNAQDIGTGEADWNGRWDAIVLLGSLEHFGLGFYGDREDPSADYQTMASAARWLKPGGFLYYDVPWTPAEYYITENRHFRVYDDTALAERITPAGLTVERHCWAVGNPDPPPDFTHTRPEVPMVPFWYVVRLLRKPA